MQQAICRRFKARLKESQARTLERAGDIRLENEAAMESNLAVLREAMRTNSLLCSEPDHAHRIMLTGIHPQTTQSYSL
jgi:hypothetical protein